VNLGSGEEIKIKDLLSLIAEALDYEGQILWDTSKPDGQLARTLCMAKAKDEFGFEVHVELRDGVRRAVECYLRETGRACSCQRASAMESGGDPRT